MVTLWQYSAAKKKGIDCRDRQIQHSDSTKHLLRATIYQTDFEKK